MLNLPGFSITNDLHLILEADDIKVAKMDLQPFRQSPGLCGPASLKIILKYFGIEATEEELANHSKATEEDGVGANGIKRAAEKYGVDCEILDFCEISDITKAIASGKAVIVSWWSSTDGHYSPVKEVTAENILLQDPELGAVRALRLDTFKRFWFDFDVAFLKSKDDILIRRMLTFIKK